MTGVQTCALPILSNWLPGVCETWALNDGHLLSIGIADGKTVYIRKSGPGSLTVTIAQGGKVVLPEGAFIKATGGLAASWDANGVISFGVVKSTRIENIGGVDIITEDANARRAVLTYKAQRSLADFR